MWHSWQPPIIRSPNWLRRRHQRGSGAARIPSIALPNYLHAPAFYALIISCLRPRSVPVSLKKIHFIGIGGTGMSAIALLLLDRGLQVSGSDLNDSHYFRAVTAHGANTALGHHPELSVAADVVVRSSAIKDDDPEVSAALSAGVPVLSAQIFSIS